MAPQTTTTQTPDLHTKPAHRPKQPAVQSPAAVLGPMFQKLGQQANQAERQNDRLLVHCMQDPAACEKNLAIFRSVRKAAEWFMGIGFASSLFVCVFAVPLSVGQTNTSPWTMVLVVLCIFPTVLGGIARQTPTSQIQKILLLQAIYHGQANNPTPSTTASEGRTTDGPTNQTTDLSEDHGLFEYIKHTWQNRGPRRAQRRQQKAETVKAAKAAELEAIVPRHKLAPRPTSRTGKLDTLWARCMADAGCCEQALTDMYRRRSRLNKFGIFGVVFWFALLCEIQYAAEAWLTDSPGSFHRLIALFAIWTFQMGFCLCMQLFLTTQIQKLLCIQATHHLASGTPKPTLPNEPTPESPSTNA